MRGGAGCSRCWSTRSTPKTTSCSASTASSTSSPSPPALSLVRFGACDARVALVLARSRQCREVRSGSPCTPTRSAECSRSALDGEGSRKRWMAEQIMDVDESKALDDKELLAGPCFHCRPSPRASLHTPAPNLNRAHLSPHPSTLNPAAPSALGTDSVRCRSPISVQGCGRCLWSRTCRFCPKTWSRFWSDAASPRAASPSKTLQWLTPET